MQEDTSSLDRLHDIVTPPYVPFWPLAPGWYVLLAILGVVLLTLAVRAWQRWKLNAYRREALRALESATSPSGISELLRRTALAIAPRDCVAALTGTEWPAWLQDRSPAAMPREVRAQLANAAYQKSGDDTRALRAYAESWIRHHRAS